MKLKVECLFVYESFLTSILTRILILSLGQEIEEEGKVYSRITLQIETRENPSRQFQVTDLIIDRYHYLLNVYVWT